MSEPIEEESGTVTDDDNADPDYTEDENGDDLEPDNDDDPYSEAEPVEDEVESDE